MTFVGKILRDRDHGVLLALPGHGVGGLHHLQERMVVETKNQQAKVERPSKEKAERR